MGAHGHTHGHIAMNVTTDPFPWKCPFCGHDTTITSTYHEENEYKAFLAGSKVGTLGVRYSFTVCPNTKCKEVAFTVVLFTVMKGRGEESWHPRQTWQLIPASQAKPFPNYIPQPILDDYREACLIKDLSAKASATLARRCLQGIIRDFWKISKTMLKDEIDALKERIGTDLWDAIDALRKIGNIGAHMERDVNLIIDVDPEEAEKLIGLIELLFKEWYIARHDREETLKELKALGEKTPTRTLKSD